MFPVKQNKKIYFLSFLGIAIIFLLLRYVGFSEVWQSLASINPVVFLGIFALTIVSTIIAGVRIYYFLRVHKQEVNLEDSYHINAFGMLGNALTPVVHVGGEFLRIFLFKKRGATVPSAVSSIVLAKILDLLVILPILVLFGLYFFYEIGLFALLLLIPLIFFVYFFGFTSLARRGTVYRAIRKIPLVPERFKVEKIPRFDFSFKDLFTLALLSYGRWLIFGLEDFLIVRFLGLEVGFVAVLGILTISILVRFVSPLPFGLGTTEAATAGLYSYLGVAAGKAATIALIGRTYVTFAIILIGGFSGLRIGWNEIKKARESTLNDE